MFLLAGVCSQNTLNAQTKSTQSASTTDKGLDISLMDKSVRPQDDF